MIIRGGEAALPGAAAPVRADIRIEGERIAEIAPNLAVRPGEQVVDAAGLLALPGAIDPHVHFDTPGFTEREDFLHGSAEAARGGVTTVVDMPCTSLPPVVSTAALENKLKAVAPMALVDYGFYGGVHGDIALPGVGAPDRDRIEKSMAELAPRVLAFKSYLLSGMDTFPRVTHEDLGRAIAQAAALGRPLCLHAEDADYVSAARRRVEAARAAAGPGKTAATWDDYVDSRPEAAEAVAVAAAVALARGAASTLHVVHVGTSVAVEALAAAGASCETCSHYLAFSREDFLDKESFLKTAPPVKTRGEAEKLWALLAEGKIAFVTSDHAPARPEEKRTGSVWTDYGGIPGVGTTLPYLFSEGYLTGRLTLGRFLDAIAFGAARRYGLASRKGSLEVGKDADFVLIDPRARTAVSGSALYSKGKDTPFDGKVLRGSIRSTWVRGTAVYDAGAAAGTASRRGAGASHADIPGIVGDAGYGKFLTWGYS
jgi:allantoinase